VERNHSYISRVTLDDARTWENPMNQELGPSSGGGFEDDGFPDTLAGALRLADEMDDEDKEFLLSGVKMNLAIAEVGRGGDCGTGCRFGGALMDFSDEAQKADIAMKIRSTCAAASDARMSGVEMPVMSSAGSGNHGIAAILPMELLGRHLGKEDRDIAHAIAISHLATSFVKRSMGRLSPVCGCAIAAGSGSAAGMTSLMGGNVQQISCAMSLLLSNFAGMLCDGAKESCALKVGAAAAEAYYSAKWAMAGQCLHVPQGVFGTSIEQTVQNIGEITQKGMKSMDNVIIEILDTRLKA
jgi:L-cysteine desulfidase